MKILITEQQYKNLKQGTVNSNLNNLKCVPTEFRETLNQLINEGYNKRILKVALSVIGRESSYASGLRYNITAPLKQIASVFGVDTSVGPGQMKQTTADELNVKESLSSIRGALIAVYRYIVRSYKIAKEQGYTNQPSTNFKEGSGDSALDIAIASYNIGVGRIKKYCNTNDPNIKRNCELSGQLVEGKKYKVTNVVAKNYIPNYKTKRWDGVDISTHGYVKEVVENMKSFTCF